MLFVSCACISVVTNFGYKELILSVCSYVVCHVQPAVSRPYVVLKVLEAADMKKYGADMFSKQIICHLSRK